MIKEKPVVKQQQLWKSIVVTRKLTLTKRFQTIGNKTAVTMEI